MLDRGPATSERTDYAKGRGSVPRAVAAVRFDLGIATSGSGAGIPFASNKPKWSRAAWGSAVY